MTATTRRLPAAERRQAIVAAAQEVFREGGYRGATTAEMARRAGVSEPTLYRHFVCKRDLYLAALEDAWGARQRLWDAAIEAEADPARWPEAMVQAVHGQVVTGWDLWFQALAEASDDDEIRAALVALMEAAHSYLASIFRRAAQAGALSPDCDPDGAAWSFISLGLLVNATRRLGAPLPQDVHATLLAGQFGCAR